MRFSLFTVAALSATAAFAAPAALKKRDNDLTALGTGLCYLEAGLGVTDITDLLDDSTGGAIGALEKTLGVTSLESAIGLSGCDTDGLSDLELVGKSLCNLEKGLGVTAISDLLDTAVGGAITKLEDKLGVTALEDAIKLSDC